MRSGSLGHALILCNSPYTPAYANDNEAAFHLDESHCT